MASPRLRPVRGFPLQAKGPDGNVVQVLGLTDAQQISRHQLGLAPAFQRVMPLMDGSRSVEEIVAQVGGGLQTDMLQKVIAQLDAAGFLEGPTFEAMLAEVRRQFNEVEDLPPGSTADFADALVQQTLVEEAKAAGEEPREATDEERTEQGPARFRAALNEWMDEAAKAIAEQAEQAGKTAPAPLESLPRALVVPHIDYARGWVNYAAAWGKLRGLDRPDRVIVLGTNHFGRGTGVTACEKGFTTPLGTCKADRAAVAHLKDALGDGLTQNQLDHENEHSIELQIPWIQAVFGEDDSGAYVPIVGVLVHDPTVNDGESYDRTGVGMDAFVAALRSAIETLPGRTLVVVSADLSHVGPAFGDEQPLTGEEEPAKAFRDKVLQHDRDMLEIVRTGSADDLIGAMSWQQNPTRWCSIGAITAALKALEPESVEPIHYMAAMDQSGMSLVSSAAMVVR
jgi:AmmeMemoRadiSam system protein B